MGMEDFTRHQQGIIKRYYANADGIHLQRLSELVGELYLAEGKKKTKVWQSVAAAMQKLGVPQARIDHIVAQDKPELVANVVKELQAK
jgi:acetylornithine deacetylase/succinyl-diaminopimelate desuccinylase-like protein